MTNNSEGIRKDTKKRTLGERFKTDTDWISNDDYRSDTFETSSEIAVDITGSNITFFLEKETTVLILVTANIQTGGGAGAIGILSLIIDGSGVSPEIEGTDMSGEPMTGTTHIVQTLAAGSHIVKLQLRSAVPSMVYVTHRRLSLAKLVE